MAKFKKAPKPVVLIIMDGVGVASPGPGNGITLADTKNLNELWPKYPHTYLEASGLNVGLPSGTDGNSEVGHMTLGSGKVIFQDLPRIDNAIFNESFFDNPVLKDAFKHAKKTNGAVHLIGLCGTGQVHSSIEHLDALIRMGANEKVDPDKFFIHAITDGRDSNMKAGVSILDKIEGMIAQRKVGKLASIIGRAYAMDRNRNWKKIKLAYDLYTKGSSTTSQNWRKYLEDSYKKEIFDEYIEPVSLVEAGGSPVTVKDGDSIIFFNFRPDRAYQITYAFEGDDFKEFERTQIKDLYYVGMADYESGYPSHKAFPPEKIIKSFGNILSKQGLSQLRIAESEKFPHVTYFFNGQHKEREKGETWIEVPSPKDVSTYDQKPEMSMRYITDVLIDKVNQEDYAFVLVNFAGPDMVAHTGNIDATVKAMEVCDECVGRICEVILQKGGVVLLTADHGNAEELIDLQTGQPDTKHSTNQVPLLIVGEGLDGKEIPVGGLSDVAPTILSLMGIEIPAEMTGRNLLD